MTETISQEEYAALNNVMKTVRNVVLDVLKTKDTEWIFAVRDWMRMLQKSYDEVIDARRKNDALSDKETG